MNAPLSDHIRALIDAAMSATQSADQKASVLQVAALSQLNLDNDFLLYTVAGPLSEAAKAVFGSLASVLVLTEHHRRQIFFAVLACFVHTNQIEEIADDEDFKSDLIHSLLTVRDQDIVTHWYGTCPPGYLSLVRRCGEIALPARFYVELHELCVRRPKVAQVLVKAANTHPILSLEMLEIVQHLPETDMSVLAAIRFGSLRTYKHFHQTYRILTQRDDIAPADLAKIAAGETPANVVNHLYLSKRFPKPILSAQGFQHIPDGHTLFRAAREFQNCVRAYFSEALRGECQFYIVRRRRTQPAIICLTFDGFHWYLSEAKCRRNASVPDNLLSEIHDVLRHANIRCDDRNITAMMAPYIRNDDSDFDQIALMQDFAA